MTQSIYTTLGGLSEYKIDQLNDLSAHLAQKETDLIQGSRSKSACLKISSNTLSDRKLASNAAVAIYTEKQVTPRELKTLIESLRRNFQLAKTNINGACEKLRKEIEKREEAGLHLVTLLTTLQEAELALGKSQRKNSDKTCI